MVAQCFIKVPFVGNPPPLQLGTPTGPIRGRLGSWYPSIIWKNHQVCIHTPRVPYYKIGSLICITGTSGSPSVCTSTHTTGPLLQDRVPYAHHRNLQVCVRVHTPPRPPRPPRAIIKKNRVPYKGPILQYYQGTTVY